GLVEQLFGKQLSPAELQQFLTLIFYPRESLELVDPSLQDPAQRRAFCQRTLHCLFDLVRVLARRFSIGRVVQVFPEEYSELMRELLIKPPGEGSNEYVTAVVDSLVQNERAFQLIRLTVRVARDLAIDELIIAGDFWDRGVRGDRVMEYVRRQPNVTITWGNHDAAWLGACLGSEALVAHVLRISVRYRRLSQLEEGYGITLQPLEHLVRAEYADDPADCFIPKGTGLRETIQMARMQKAAAIMQHKLEGQMIERNPHWKLEHRRLLHQIDHKAGTIQIEGKTYPLRDTHFPTIDPAKPYELSSEEKACLDRIRQSFL